MTEHIIYLYSLLQKHKIICSLAFNANKLEK
jgi:hypothetical protein